MKKKISKTVLFMGIVVLVALYPITGAVAQDECEIPLSYTTERGWTVTLMDGYPMKIDPDLYEWKYSVANRSGNTKGLNHINFSLPACCPDPIPILYSEPAAHIFLPPGTPDDTTGFGKGILQSFVIKWSLNDPQNTDWFFYTNTKELAKGTAGLKVGNKFELCEIAVPGCPEPEPTPELAQAAVTTMSFVTTEDGREFMIDEDPYTQCINWVYEKVPCEGTTACRPPQGSEQKCEYNVPREDCDDGWYWYPLDKAMSSEVLTATPAGGGEAVTDVASQAPCGRAVIKAGDNTNWFFLMFGWAFF